MLFCIPSVILRAKPEGSRLTVILSEAKNPVEEGMTVAMCLVQFPDGILRLRLRMTVFSLCHRVILNAVKDPAGMEVSIAYVLPFFTRDPSLALRMTVFSLYHLVILSEAKNPEGRVIPIASISLLLQPRSFASAQDDTVVFRN